jgi:PAS domain S-box-containing protein
VSLKKNNAETVTSIFRESWYKDILNNSSGAIYVKDNSGRYIFANKTTQKITGKKSQEIVGKKDSDLYDKKYAKQYIKNDKEVIKGNKAITFEEEGCFNGLPYISLSNKFPLYNSNNEINAVCGISYDISALKNYENKLKKALYELGQQKIKTDRIINSIPGVIIEMDCEKSRFPPRVTFISDNIQKITGNKRTDFIVDKSLFYNLFDSRSKKKFITDIRSAIKKKSSFINQYYWTTSDSKKIIVEISGQAIESLNGDVLGISGVLQEITENALLKENEAKLTSIISNSPDAIISMNFRLQILEFNKSSINIFNISPSNLSGLSIYDLFSEEYKPKIEGLIEKISRRNLTEKDELVIPYKRKKDTIYLSITGSVLKDNDNLITGYYFICRDTTERYKSRLIIMEKEAEINKLINANVLGVCFWTDGFYINAANRNFLNITGISRKSLFTKRVKLFSLFAEGQENKSKAILKDLSTTGKIKSTEVDIINHNGYRVPVLLGGVSFDSSKQSGIVFFMDITERKDLERKKDEFVSMVSHELKTPLTSLIIYLNLISKDKSIKKNSNIYKYLQKLHSQTDKLKEIVNDLLDVARIDTNQLDLNKSAIDINKLVKDEAEDLSHFTKSHKILISGNIKNKVLADSHRIAQVLTNLITNAVKYSPEGKEIRINKYEREGYAHIEVIDKGIGISKKNQEKLFNRFYRASGTSEKTYPGLGIGLYISKAIVNKHGGELKVFSKRGSGSVFTFTCPLVYDRKNKNEQTATK